jgi:ribosome-associated protein
MKAKKSALPGLVKIVCQVLDDKKAGDLTVLDVSEQSSITDYLVLATATSEPHLRALRVELEKAFDANGVRLVGTEAPQESGWIVLDAFDVMVHLFLPSMRDRYGLERLWQDAKLVPTAKVLAAPAKSAKTVKRSASAAKRKPRTKK